MSANAIELRDVFCVHRTPEGDAAALQGLSLKLRHGERACVLGPSGAGKTTLLQVVAGLQAPSAGSVLVFGTDIGRQSARRRARIRHHLIGFLDQRAEGSLAPDLPIAAAVALSLALRGIRRAERRARAAELLAAAGLADRADALPAHLSGGERQRAALCAALAHRPALLLADEPTAELDAASAKQVAALIEELAANEGTAVLMVSHDPAMELGTRRVVRMRDGRIVEERRDGHASLVIAADGWVQLPRPLLEQSGIGRRARAAVSGAGLLLTPAARAAAAAAADAVANGRDSASGGRDAVTMGLTGPPPPRASLPPVPVPVRVQLERVWRWQGEGAGRQAVIADLSTDFEPGRLTAVTGRSGSGKTTLLELLACLEPPAAGQLWIDDEPLAAAGRERRAELRRRLIGYLPQEPAPVGFLSATENVVLALQIRGVRGESAARQAEAVLERIGLADRRRQRVARLSAGEAQRLALARALACAQGLLVVDEPTSRLDAAAAAGVAELLYGAARQGQTVICATHDPRLIGVADRVLELERFKSLSLPPPPSSAILSSPTTAEEPA